MQVFVSCAFLTANILTTCSALHTVIAGEEEDGTLCDQDVPLGHSAFDTTVKGNLTVNETDPKADVPAVDKKGSGETDPKADIPAVDKKGSGEDKHSTGSAESEDDEEEEEEDEDVPSADAAPVPCTDC
eukprot:TRINITY_DN1593_c0_g1_i2.p2 TRINITY_DN1593_c0_g1~~TRINITY_DN1593_c0_g1_i2.p2  ORF type:complete len:129 (+),score=42.17 TRINITY_DN1593_c0_g1_i2:98-484(+)